MLKHNDLVGLKLEKYILVGLTIVKSGFSKEVASLKRWPLKRGGLSKEVALKASD